MASTVTDTDRVAMIRQIVEEFDQKMNRFHGGGTSHDQESSDRFSLNAYREAMDKIRPKVC